MSIIRVNGERGDISIPARRDVHTHSGGAGRVGPFDQLVKILIGSGGSDGVKHGVTFFFYMTLLESRAVSSLGGGLLAA